MSGYAAIPSAGADPNILYRALSGQEASDQQNALLQQQRQQQAIALTDQDVVSRAAGALYSMPEDQAAAAYPGMVSSLRQAGFKLAGAPDSYPGHAAIGAMLQRGMPIESQINTGFLMPPGFAGLPPLPGMPGYGAPSGGQGQAAPPAAPSGGGSGTAQMGGVTVPKEYLPFYQEASQRTGIPVDVLIAQGRQESGFNPGATGAAGEIGIHQIKPSTARDPGYGMTGVNPDTLRDPRTNINFAADYLRARMGQNANPASPQAITAGLAAYNGGGDPNYIANVTRYMPSGAPQTGGGVAARTGGTDVAGPPGTVPTTPPAGTVATPAGPDTIGPRPLPPTGVGQPVVTPPQLANTPYTPQQNALGPQPTVAAPPAPAPQPTATAQAATPPPAPPTQPPIAPQTGINSPQFQMAQQLESQAAQYAAGAKIPGPLGARYAAEAARLHQLAQLYMQADSVSVDPATGIQTHILTGKQDPSAQPDVKTTMTGDGLVVTDSKTGQVLRVIPARPAVSPRSVAGAGPDPQNPGKLIQGHWTIGPNGLQDFVPEATQPADAPYKIQSQAYKEDSDAIPGIFTSAQAAQGNMLRYNELARLVPEIQSGGLLGPARARIAGIMEANGFSPEAIQRLTGMSGGAAAQEFNKLAVATVGQAAKGDLGSNVGIQSLHLYADANPGMGLLPDANKRMTNMGRVMQQFNQDYANGAMQHFNANQGPFLRGEGYSQPLSTFNSKWLQRNNPQIGFAAMGILNGDPVSSYASRTSAEERQTAFDMAKRIDPTAHMTVKTDADFAAIPKGATFQAPDGTVRVKP